MNNHVTVLEIDGNAVLHNLNYFKQKLRAKTKILIVLKSYGYGSSPIKIARLLEDKIDYIAVAYTDEGIDLRKAGIKIPILVLHPQVENLKLIINHNLEPNLYNFKIFYAFLNLANKSFLENYPIHLKFNTGLYRLGFSNLDIPKISKSLKNTNSIKVRSLLSHLAASEDLKEKNFTLNQIKNFTSVADEFYKIVGCKPMLHILNTSGVLNYPNAQFDMVRIGIGLFGFSNNEHTYNLKNSHNLKSIISQIHSLEKGTTVGYNRAFITEKNCKVATIPIGHADGLPRSLGNENGFVVINNEKAKIIGNVCMDMIMVNITDIKCNEGDEVIIFNNQKMIERIANASNTIVYEVLTNISRRVKKVLKLSV